MRKWDREERRRKRDREGDQDEGRDVGEVEVAGYAVNKEVTKDGADEEGSWGEAEVDGDELLEGDLRERPSL